MSSPITSFFRSSLAKVGDENEIKRIKRPASSSFHNLQNESNSPLKKKRIDFGNQSSSQNESNSPLIKKRIDFGNPSSSQNESNYSPLIKKKIDFGNPSSSQNECNSSLKKERIDFGNPSSSQDSSKEKESSSFIDFTLPWNLILIVEEKKLYTRKEILANASPIFAEKFSNHGDYTGILELPDVKIADFEELLNFIYPLNKKITGETNIRNLLKLSEAYEIEKIQNLCKEYLMDQSPPTMEHFQLAQEFNLENVIKKCIDFFALAGFKCFNSNQKKYLISYQNKKEVKKQRAAQMELFVQKLYEKTVCSSI